MLLHILYVVYLLFFFCFSENLLFFYIYPPNMQLLNKVYLLYLVTWLHLLFAFLLKRMTHASVGIV